MRLLRPSPALVVALLALLLAAGGGAYAAVRSTGSAVNIVDKTTAANVAKVSSGGSLQISGSVTATPTSATNYLRAARFGLSSISCQPVLAAPTGKAMIITEVVVDTFSDPSPGSGQAVGIWVGSGGTCNEEVADVNPPTVGPQVVTFSPGLTVPAGSFVGVDVRGNVQAEAFVYGYSVSSTSVPPIAQSGSEAPHGNGS
jgi:hypothetical protein